MPTPLFLILSKLIDFIKVLINRPFDIKKCEFPLVSEYYSNKKEEEKEEEEKTIKARHKFYNLEIEEYSRHFILQGSIHVFWNLGKHNYNDFYYNDIVSIIQSLQNGFNIKLDEGQIINLEYGLNIPPPLLTTEIFLRGLILHKGKPTFKDPKNHFEFKDSATGGDYKQVRRQQFYLKYYDKAKHYGLTGQQILRIETKYKKRNPLIKLGVNQLQDLLNIEILKNLHNDLLKKWNEVLFINQNINGKHLSKTIQNHLKDFKDKHFWIDLYKYSTKQQRQYYFSLLDDLNQFYGGNIKEEVKKALNQKFESLF